MSAAITRRSVLQASLLAGLSAEVLEALQHAHEAAQGDGKLQYLDASAAAEIEALAAQIIPSGDGAGAKEAGVVFFIDRALATFDQDQRELYKTGLAAAGPGASIAKIEHTEFFEALRKHVIMGFLAAAAWRYREQVGVVAKELATAGFSVVVLEQGPYLRERDFKHDEFGTVYQSALVNNYKTQPNTARRTEDETAKPMPAVGYGRQVGGGSVHFTGNYWRFHESDFHERSMFGAVPGANLSDWPIQYADLEPYYTKAEYELGISGLGGSNPFDGPRSKPYPLPPMPIKSSGVLFERAAKKLGLHPFPAPMAILSQPYQGRGACVNCGFCESFGCEMRAKSSTLATVIPMAEKTGNCEIRADAYVRKIEIDKTGRVTGAIYFDSKKKEIFQKAKTVIVCANGAETPRLLLLSQSNRFPHGLANSSGVVGRNLMVDTWAFAYGVFDHPLNEYKGIQVTRVLHDYYEADPKRGFYGGAGIDGRFDYYPISFALEALPPGTPKWGPQFKKALADNFTRTMTMEAHCSCLPVETNSISLDPQVKDAWGLPAIRVTYDSHADDVKTTHFAAERMLELMDAAGARKTWDVSYGDVLPSVHLMGTCRMGSDPAKSVVNADNRAHDVPNLFLVDGSSLVTCGRQQPTATIQALAYRAADRIGKMARNREL